MLIGSHFANMGTGIFEDGAPEIMLHEFITLNLCPGYCQFLMGKICFHDLRITVIVILPESQSPCNLTTMVLKEFH